MKRLITGLAVAAGLATLAGCSQHPFIPAAAIAYHQHTTKPKLPPPLLGVDVYSETDYTPQVTSGYGKLVLGYIKDSLHAQVVGLMWDLCSPGFKSDTVTSCKSDAKSGTGSMSPADIRRLADQAKTDGLQVAMRPIIRVGPPSDWNHPKRSWEGNIQPANETTWFSSLLKAELPYLKVAKSVHVEQFVVTTELGGLRYSVSWPSFLSKAQSDCGCQVSYSDDTGQYLKNSPDSPPIKALGTDYYPDLRLPASARQAQVTTAWEQSLASIAESRLDRTSVDEVSIRGTAGAYQHPAIWNDVGKADPTVQVRYFTAACATIAHYRMRAIFFYFVPLDDNPGAPTQFPAYFIKNRASKAIAGCRRILAKG
jgi:hypothetical protein